jgi:hypothetical protein
MTSFDVNSVDSIVIKFLSGEEIEYTGRGLEKLRKLMVSSPAYGEAARRVVVDDDDEAEEVPSRPKQKKSGRSRRDEEAEDRYPAPRSASGYNVVPLQYSSDARDAVSAGGLPSKGRSAMDVASEMRRQAEATSGIRFGS